MPALFVGFVLAGMGGLTAVGGEKATGDRSELILIAATIPARERSSPVRVA